ncbi:hypothetical protein JMM61_19310 [Rhodovulum sulfidophilum]|uniref:hypothetical protein n=1 Tax=Rhodovulum sulfidophilum TaxID=35806 RepID=UPI001927C561|nr:hypothetical protein [Rhodovulum sulfidophilum]MBL3587493.1 hypothetical protein [Rhodovulum sulfidophilum]
MNTTSPIDLSDLYVTLRMRLAVHVSDGCDEITLRLPREFDGELAFYRLVNWAYALVNEAARIPLPYLANLPPLRANDIYKREIVFLRTYLNHNLKNEKRDLKTAASAARWFGQACGRGSPREPEHYAAACHFLADRLRAILEGAIDACDLLDDPIDGTTLVANLHLQVSQAWEAHRFDPILKKCAEMIGNPGIDLLKFRGRKLDIWRAAVKNAEAEMVEAAVRRQIEADLLSEIDARLPIGAQEAKAHLSISGKDAVVAALLLLRDARFNGKVSIPDILIQVRRSIQEPED